MFICLILFVFLYFIYSQQLYNKYLAAFNVFAKIHQYNQKSK